MSFLPDARMTCEVCGGRRFDRETREVRFKGLDIGQMLALSVDEAIGIFAAHSEGGDAGGRIVARDAPEQVAAAGDAPTAGALRRHLGRCA